MQPKIQLELKPYDLLIPIGYLQIEYIKSFLLVNNTPIDLSSYNLI